MALELPEESKGNSGPTIIEQVLGSRWNSLSLGIQAISSIVAGVAGSYVVADKVADPLLRWAIEAALVFFFGAASYRQWEKSQESTLYAIGEQRFTKRGKFPTLAFLAIAMSFGLAADLISTFNGAFNPIVVSQPIVTHVGLDVCASEKDAKELASLRFITLDVIADRNPPENKSHAEVSSSESSMVDYRIGKRDNFKEAWITEMEIVVDEFREFPKIGDEVPRAYVYTTALPFEKKTTIVTELRNESTKKLPWSFKPSYVLVDDKRELWERGRFRFSDAFCDFFGFRFFATGKENAGLFRVRIKAKTSSGIGGESEMELPGSPIWLGFFVRPSSSLAIQENEKFIVSPSWEVTPKASFISRLAPWNVAPPATGAGVPWAPASPTLPTQDDLAPTPPARPSFVSPSK